MKKAAATDKAKSKPKPKAKKVENKKSSLVSSKPKAKSKEEVVPALKKNKFEFMSRLPDEIWVMILREFDHQELCVIGLTCSSLLRLTRDPALWTRLSLDEDMVMKKEAVSSLLSRCPALTSLNVTGDYEEETNISYMFQGLAAACHNLQDLKIKRCHPLTFSDLQSLSTGCPRLRSLSLEYTGWFLFRKFLL